MQQSIWAFWDAEGLPQLLAAEKLVSFDRFWLVYTHKNPLPFCDERQKDFLERARIYSNVEDIRTVLAFLVGEAHKEAGREVDFQVFSTDKKLKPLIKHLNTVGRGCQRIVPEVHTPPIDTQLAKVLQTLEKRPVDLRPKTEDALLNFLENILPPNASVARVWEELQARELMEKTENSDQVVCINEQLGWTTFLLLENLRGMPLSKRPARYNRLVNHIKTFFTRQVNPHLLIEQLRHENFVSTPRHNHVIYHF